MLRNICKQSPRFIAMGTLCVAVSAGCTAPLAEDKAGVGSGSFSDPVQIRRDNPAIGGRIYVDGTQVKGSVGSDTKSFSQAKWTNATGFLQVIEYRQNGTQYARYKTPLLPQEDFQSPGAAAFGTRAVPLVHGNVYAIGGQAAGSSIETQNAETWYAKLSDDVAVVPIVLVHWVPRGGSSSSEFRATTAGAFDFYPAFAQYSGRPGVAGHAVPQKLQSPTIDQQSVTSSNFNTWSAGLAQYRPFGRWTPPDELFAKCGVQFQVVDEVTITLPANWIAGNPENCSVHGENAPNPRNAYLTAQNNSVLARYITEKLRPAFVSLANYQCSTWHGVTANGTGLVDLELNAPAGTLAHELGHVVGLSHTANTETTNLMHPGAGGPDLTDRQCQTARNVAMNYSRRFDEFNRVTGRTYSSTPPDLAGEVEVDDGGGDFGGSGPVDLGICCSAFPVNTAVSREQCTAAGGHEVECPQPDIR
ncbi:MAG TPA: hypothetical protein VFQ61_38920 [Polyangiaceae bacterium]|nr:hypothetical protein [Polyangiaceae bacterium]